MAGVDVTIKQNDLRPLLDYTLVNSLGVALDLTGSTVTFSMSRKLGGPKKVNAQTVAVVSATLGEVRYSWQTGDTDTIGIYFGEFQVTLSGGDPLTFPQKGYIKFEVIREV